MLHAPDDQADFNRSGVARAELELLDERVEAGGGGLEFVNAWTKRVKAELAGVVNDGSAGLRRDRQGGDGRAGRIEDQTGEDEAGLSENRDGKQDQEKQF